MSVVVPPDTMDQLVSLTERDCVVYQSLNSGTALPATIDAAS
ncbi:hypothetical protein [Microbaculum sp. FT89]